MTSGTASLAPPTDAPGPLLAAWLYRLTAQQFDRMNQDGTIADVDRVELIEGLLVTKMGGKRPHVQAGNKGFWTLVRILGPGWHIRKDDPVVISEWSKPEPDLVVVRGEVADYDNRDVTAADVAVVVEIADSSLSADQNDMARVSAGAGIPVYWVVNLVDRQVEVYTAPGPAGYAVTNAFGLNQDVVLVIDEVEVGRIAVAEMMP
jgi:Uma2 family endonuclease